MLLGNLEKALKDLSNQKIIQYNTTLMLCKNIITNITYEHTTRIDEFDEESFDELGESYLKRIYENVESFKTCNGKITDTELMLEGIITFKSGKKAKTNFTFESRSATKRGKVKLVGSNKQLSEGKKAFTITGNVTNKKLITESFTYNYKATDAKTGKSTRLYGTVRK